MVLPINLIYPLGNLGLTRLDRSRKTLTFEEDNKSTFFRNHIMIKIRELLTLRNYPQTNLKDILKIFKVISGTDLKLLLQTSKKIFL